jgi:hypothetical protein
MADSNNNRSSDAMNRLRAIEAALRKQHREKERTDRVLHKQPTYEKSHKQKIEEEKTRRGNVSIALDHSASPVNALRRPGAYVRKTGPYKLPPAGASRTRQPSIHDWLFVGVVYVGMAVLAALIMPYNQRSSSSPPQQVLPSSLPETSFARPSGEYSSGSSDAHSLRPRVDELKPGVDEQIFPTFDTFVTARQESLQPTYDLPTGDLAPVTQEDLEGVKSAVKAFSIIGAELIDAKANTRARLCVFDVNRGSNHYLIKVEGIGQEASVNLTKTFGESLIKLDGEATRLEATKSIETILRKSSREACYYLSNIIKETASPTPPLTKDY